jgi:hypothetical protein
MYAGEILAEGRRNPIFDACRALLARGINGRLEVWRRSKTSADMQFDIELGAGLAVWESEKHSRRTAAWRPRAPDIVSSRAVQRAAAVCDLASAGHLPTKTAASDSTAPRCEHYCYEARLALTEGRMPGG